MHPCLCRDNVRVTWKTLRATPAHCYAEDSAAVPKDDQQRPADPAGSPNQSSSAKEISSFFKSQKFFEEKLVFIEYTQVFLVFLTDDVYIRQVLEMTIVSGQKQHCFKCRHVTANSSGPPNTRAAQFLRFRMNWWVLMIRTSSIGD